MAPPLTPLDEVDESDDVKLPVDAASELGAAVLVPAVW
jgi:hypothetical protein